MVLSSVAQMERIFFAFWAVYGPMSGNIRSLDMFHVMNCKISIDLLVCVCSGGACCYNFGLLQLPEYMVCASHASVDSPM